MQSIMSLTKKSPSTAEHFIPLASKLPELKENCRRIYLIRHGETDFNAAGKLQGGGYDLPLNQNGKEQAATVAEELCAVPFGVIASSHLRRAQQTADYMHQQHPTAQRIVLAGFGEMRFGDFEGVNLRGEGACKETTQRYVQWNDRIKQDVTVPWPGGGESLAQVQERAVGALQTLLEDHPAAHQVGIVAHGRTINIMLASMLRGDPRQFASFHQKNCCINVLDYDGDQFDSLVLSYDEHIHRFGKLRP
jgi:broad specificity phosphatase PhoE